MAMLEELKSMSDEHLGRIKNDRHRMDLLNNDHRPPHSALYRGSPTAGRFANVDIGQMVAVKLIEPGTTEWVGPTVSSFKMNCSICRCIDCQRLSSMSISDSYPSIA